MNCLLLLIVNAYFALLALISFNIFKVFRYVCTVGHFFLPCHTLFSIHLNVKKDLLSIISLCFAPLQCPFMPPPASQTQPRSLCPIEPS
jgi:hypothetical protein